MQGIDYKIERIRQRKTLMQMAEETGLSTGTLSMLENDKANPSRRTEEKLQAYWKGAGHARED